MKKEHCRTVQVNGQYLSDHQMKQMVRVIEWDITELKGDYTEDHNRKIKRVKMMAPPHCPIITLRHLDSYLTVSTNSTIKSLMIHHDCGDKKLIHW